MAKIGVFDSGVGGLSVLREIVKLLPGESYVYFSDNAYCPYGEKEKSFILDRAREITDWMLWKGVDIVVVACNTATAAAIAELREEYGGVLGIVSEPGIGNGPEHEPNQTGAGHGSGRFSERVSRLTGGRIDHLRFIGMEPAVKMAAERTRSGVVGVLATAGTLAADKYQNTKERWEGNTRIVEHVGEGFVELVENGEVSGQHAQQVVRASLQPLLDEGADTVVLGCTHYPFLMDVMREIAGESVEIIDPAPAVARQLLRVIREEGIVLRGPVAETITAGETREAGKTIESVTAAAPDFTFQSSGPRDALDRAVRMYL